MISRASHVEPDRHGRWLVDLSPVNGPVLPGDHPPVLPTLPAGTYPAWSPSVAYRQGQKVLRDGLAYQAKFYAQGDDPAAVLTNPSGSPWRALYTIPGEPVPAG